MSSWGNKQEAESCGSKDKTKWPKNQQNFKNHCSNKKFEKMLPIWKTLNQKHTIGIIHSESSSPTNAFRGGDHEIFLEVWNRKRNWHQGGSCVICLKIYNNYKIEKTND